jgi:dihydrofolate synthase/folylpolyglutamate synthase
MDFSESLEYLLNLGNEVLAMKLGLENIGKLLAALGNPEKNFLKIQVAGTNGKGSTCAFLDSICVSADIKTGLFTSPHLVSITERIKINGQEISEEDFARHATKVREISERLLKNGELDCNLRF